MDRVHWLLIADERQARLYTCRRRPEGGLAMEHSAALENSYEHSHEHGRPALLGGAERQGSVARSGAHAAPHTAAAARNTEEEAQRFAREVARWLKGRPLQHPGAGLSVFAPPRFLGLLRVELDGTADMHAMELARLGAHELLDHPAVRAALSSR